MPTRRLFLGLIPGLALLPLPATAQARKGGPVRDIAGSYAANGMNADGSRYAGTVEIAQSGATIEMSWSIGNDSYRGTGTLEGRVLSVDWGSDSPVIYVVMNSGELPGTRGDGTALEKLPPR